MLFHYLIGIVALKADEIGMWQVTTKNDTFAPLFAEYTPKNTARLCILTLNPLRRFSLPGMLPELHLTIKSIQISKKAHKILYLWHRRKAKYRTLSNPDSSVGSWLPRSHWLWLQPIFHPKWLIDKHAPRFKRKSMMFEKCEFCQKWDFM